MAKCTSQRNITKIEKLRTLSCELGTRSLQKSEFRVVDSDFGIMKSLSSEL